MLLRLFSAGHGDYLAVLRRRCWLFGLCIVLGLAAAPVAVCELTKAVSRWGKKKAAEDTGPARSETKTRRRTSVRH